MKLSIFFLAWLVYLQPVSAQNPVTWEYNARKINNESYEISLVAMVQGKWHIYSQFTPGGGPVPTQIVFNKNPMIVINGPVKEAGKLHEKHEEVFDIQVKYYEGMVVFKQLVTMKKKVKTKISGTVEYMLCDDSQCLPPKKVSFSIELK